MRLGTPVYRLDHHDLLFNYCQPFHVHCPEVDVQLCFALGHLPVIQKLVSEGLVPTSQHADIVCGGDFLETLEWLKFLGILPTRKGIKEAVQAKQFGVLQWLEQHCITPQIPDEDNLMYVACFGGSMPCILWLERHGIFPSRSDAFAACCGGNVEVVRWLLTHNKPPDDYYAFYFKGHLECLQLLTEEGLHQPSVSGANIAKKRGHEDILLWLSTQGVYASI